MLSLRVGRGRRTNARDSESESWVSSWYGHNLDCFDFVFRCFRCVASSERAPWERRWMSMIPPVISGSHALAQLVWSGQLLICLPSLVTRHSLDAKWARCCEICFRSFVAAVATAGLARVASSHRRTVPTPPEITWLCYTLQATLGRCLQR